MDVDILSDIIKELIINNDKISVRGLGYFVSKPCKASLSDDGKFINPPSRLISFVSDEQAAEDVIERYYSERNNADLETVKIEFDIFVKKLKSVLLGGESVDLAGLGTLRSTPEGDVCFVADDNFFSSIIRMEPVAVREIENDGVDMEETMSGNEGGHEERKEGEEEGEEKGEKGEEKDMPQGSNEVVGKELEAGLGKESREASGEQPENKPESKPEKQPEEKPGKQPEEKSGKQLEEKSGKQREKKPKKKRRAGFIVLTILLALIILIIIFLILLKFGILDTFLYSSGELELIRNSTPI